MHLNLFLRSEGHHYAAWRHESSRPDLATDIDHIIEVARVAERGLFDSVFLADGPAIGNNPWQYLLSPFDPVTTLTAIARGTERIGLIGTMSTTYFEPYNLARQLASLDHISRGRAGWNLVTTSSLKTADNFTDGGPLSHTDRYLRAAEFYDVVLKLWDSWEDDAIVADKASGVYVDPAKVHEINYKGEWFSVKGPLNVARSPQGRPVIVQAGSSEEGMEFGARIADAIYTSQHTLEQGQAFYGAMKAITRQNGRDPDSIKILPGLAPILGSTVAEAQKLRDDLAELTEPTHSLRTLSNLLQLDLTQYPLDGPVPLDDLLTPEEVEGHRSRFTLIVDMCKQQKLTLRQLVYWHISGVGHRNFVGTPEQLVDDIQTWLDNGAADGFNLMPSLSSNGLVVFVDEVVPLLQKRGLFRTEYESTTLRGHLGLPRP